MLNYIWISLITIGIALALVYDFSNEIDNSTIYEKSYNAKVLFDGGNYKFQFPNEIKPFFDSNNFKFNSQKLTENSRIDLSVLPDTSAKTNFHFFEKPKTTKIQILSLTKISDSIFSAKVKFVQEHFTKMKSVTNAILDYTKTSVNIAFGLIGIMAFWLGIMKIAEQSGLVKRIAEFSRPVMKKLFPDIPEGHPALTAMIMNISANVLGLGNAATPFGLKAMEELDKLNPEKGTATNEMCTFLAINTAGLTLIPATAIAIRAAQGSSDPTIIIGTSFFGSLIATFTGVTVAKIFEFRSKRKATNSKINFTTTLKIVGFVFLFILFAALIIKFLFLSNYSSQIISVIKVISVIAIPLIVFGFLTYGLKKKINLYATFTEGAKEGFEIAVKIIPYLVAMLVAIGVFRASGGMNILVYILSPITNLIGMPAEVLPMALMRPLSGSASIGIMSELMKTHGADSFIGVLASTILGSTETTFYVLALYFGSVNIKKSRHAVIAGVSADVAGILAALFIVKLLFAN